MMKTKRRPGPSLARLLFLCLGAGLFGSASIASAATYTSTVGTTTTGTWSLASVWQGGVAPTSNLDNVLIFIAPTGTPRVTTNNLGNGFQLNSLSMTNNTSNSNGQNLTISGNSLNFVKDSSNVLPTITLAKSANSAGAITISAPLIVTDALTITSSVNVSSPNANATTISGAVSNSGGITFNGAGNNSITYGGGVTSGTGGITVAGSYNVNMTGSNTYTGLTDVQSGTLTLNRAGGAIANASAVQVSGGALAVAQDDTVGAVTLSSGQITGAGILTGSSYSLTNTGTVGAVLAGSGHLTKTGAGTATLSGANTYTGTTTVSAGTLLLTSSGSVASATVVLGSGSTTGTFDVSSKASYSQANLSGNGTVNLGSNVLTVTGNLAPGFSAGKLDVTGALTLAGTSTSALEITGTARGIPGGYDAVDVTGSLIYGGTLVLTFTEVAPYAAGTTFNLFDATGFSGDFSSLTLSAASTPYAGLTFTETGSGASGVWTSTVVSGGAADGQYLVFDQGTGDLTVALVPEPGSVALLALGGISLVLYRARRRRF